MRKFLMIPITMYSSFAGAVLFLGLALSAGKPISLVVHIVRNAFLLVRHTPRLFRDLWTERQRLFGSTSMWSFRLPIAIIGAPFIILLLLLEDYPTEEIDTNL